MTRLKLKVALVFCGVLIIAGFIAAIAYAFLTETTSGTAASMQELAKVYRGASRTFAGYPQRSVVSRFPFEAGISWRRHQIHSQVHLSGLTDMSRLEQFLTKPPLSFISRSEREISFMADEPGVHLEGSIDLATREAKIVTLAR
jgi:hypothetical protein